MVTGQVGQVIPGTSRVTDFGAAYAMEPTVARREATMPCISFISNSFQGYQPLVEETSKVRENKRDESQYSDYRKEKLLNTA